MKENRLSIDYLLDIYHQTRLIGKFISKVSFNNFVSNDQLFYAVCRALEIIGEATKNISKEIMNTYDYIEWSKMAKLRDIIIHHYTGLNEKVIWDICKVDLKPLQKNILDAITNEMKSIDDPIIQQLVKQKIIEIKQKTKLKSS